MSDEIAKRLEYEGFSNHDCDSYYHCPVCKTGYSGWGFYRQGLKEGEKFHCIKCGTLLIYM